MTNAGTQAAQCEFFIFRRQMVTGYRGIISGVHPAEVRHPEHSLGGLSLFSHDLLHMNLRQEPIRLLHRETRVTERVPTRARSTPHGKASSKRFRKLGSPRPLVQRGGRHGVSCPNRIYRVHGRGFQPDRGKGCMEKYGVTRQKVVGRSKCEVYVEPHQQVNRDKRKVLLKVFSMKFRYLKRT